MVPSASAVASAILKASTSPVEFVHRIENSQNTGLVLPSPDFQRLCVEQLDLFRRIVDPDALLSVCVFLNLFELKTTIVLLLLPKSVVHLFTVGKLGLLCVG